MRAAADRAGEPVWPLPLPDRVPQAASSREVADIKNIGRRLRRRAHRRAVPAGVRRRRAVGAPRHRRARVARRRRRLPRRRAAPASACARWSSWRRRARFEPAEQAHRARRTRKPRHGRARKAAPVDDRARSTARGRCGRSVRRADSRSSHARCPRAGVARGQTTSSPCTSATTCSRPRTLAVEAGHHRALGQRRPEPPQRHARLAATTFGSEQPRSPGSRTCTRSPMPGTFAYYCTLHGAPGRGSTPSSRSATTSRPPTVAPVGGERRAGADDRRVGPHDPGARRRQDHPGRRRPRPARRPRAGVAGRLPRERDDRDRTASCCAGVDRNRTILDGEFKRENGVKVVGADGVAVENLTDAELHRERVLLERRARLPRLVPHRVPQRRLRHLRVRLAVGAVRPLVRVGQPRLRLLHRRSATRATRSSPT